MFSPVELENLQAIKAIGRSDIVLKLEIIKKIVGIILLVIAVPFGVSAIAWSMMLSMLFAAIANATPNRSLLGYSIVGQFRDVLPSLIMSAVVYLFVQCFVLFIPITNQLLMLMLAVLLGLCVYVLLSIIFRVDSFYYLIDTIKGFKK